MKRTKKIVGLVLLFLLLLLPSTNIFASEAFTIDNYKINMVVNDDNSYTIEETIYVDFGYNQKHGIFRTIPTISSATRNIDGKDVKKTHLIKVKDIDVVGRNYSTERNFDNIVLQIGGQ